MADIVLTTLNAKYIHAAFGLRYLLANLAELRPRACLLEFDLHQRALDIAEALLAQQPKIIGLGVYIWNVAPTTEILAVLKRIRPEIKIILGGPEVSYETEAQAIVQLADHVITGEADLKFAEICRALLAAPGCGGPPLAAPLPKVIPAPLPDLGSIVPPYDLYTDDDVAHRILYVEASRGCPFTCEFCLSSRDIPVRQFPLDRLLADLQRLLDRGVNQFKFVDRTFNLNVRVSQTILEFFLARSRPGLFCHFEMIPDRLPEALREIIARFPPGALQFEVGIQTFNPSVGAAIRRRQDERRLADNLGFLRARTGVHLHTDLIVGLPGETLESFAAGFDRLTALGPQEIQVGLLKRLRGTPIGRHDAQWQMAYSPHPPYEILSNKLINFATMQRLRRFARYWDLVGNSGNFLEATPLLWSPEQAAGLPPPRRPEGANPMPLPLSPFQAFLRFSDWLYARTGRTESLALVRLMELLFEFLTRERRLDSGAVARTLWHDYQRGGRRDQPAFLRPHLPKESAILPLPKTGKALPKRQARHWA